MCPAGTMTEGKPVFRRAAAGFTQICLNFAENLGFEVLYQR